MGAVELLHDLALAELYEACVKIKLSQLELKGRTLQQNEVRQDWVLKRAKVTVNPFAIKIKNKPRATASTAFDLDGSKSSGTCSVNWSTQCKVFNFNLVTTTASMTRRWYLTTRPSMSRSRSDKRLTSRSPPSCNKFLGQGQVWHHYASVRHFQEPRIPPTCKHTGNSWYIANKVTTLEGYILRVTAVCQRIPSQRETNFLGRSSSPSPCFTIIARSSYLCSIMSQILRWTAHATGRRSTWCTSI